MKISHIILASALSAPAAAAVDMDKMRKDVRIMSKIVSGAFETDSQCEHCRLQIEGRYLDGQGVVFDVRTSVHDFAWRGQDFTVRALPFEEAVLSGIGHMPEPIHDVVEDLEIDLEVLGDTTAIHLGDEPGVRRRIRVVDGEAIEGMRALRREQRRMGEEIREHEIAMIHADEVDREELEKRVAEMRKRMEEVGARREEMDRKLEKRVVEIRTRQTEERQKHEQRQKEQQQEIQDVVLQAFCDYGSTLGNLPKNEHVSLVFKQREHDEIMVFSRNDVTECKDDLGGKAVSYQF